MLTQTDDIIYNQISTLWPEIRAELNQMSSPIQVIEKLVAKISVLEEELEISREQVITLKAELSDQSQQIEDYREELEASHKDMEALNLELQNCYQFMESQRKVVNLRKGLKTINPPKNSYRRTRSATPTKAHG